MSNNNEGAGHRANTNASERIGMIWAEAANHVIGKDGSMPWTLPEDMAYFRSTTTGHPVIMGRKTWESFPEKFRPLPDRTNIVITRDASRHQELTNSGAIPVATALEALKAARAGAGAQEIWVIGGGEIYGLFAEAAQLALRTLINAEPEGDTKAPILDGSWSKVLSEPDTGWSTAKNGTQYRIEAWEKKA
ncbi:dihydrofolate reductase [Paeniglutamicibacter antarcticus]|uniref:Dihydrofolate reductase n=1 Tax=Paeniglutamicibacter antarcticus TaxID=494023 RepID=A0ABP9TNS6_9MICC